MSNCWGEEFPVQQYPRYYPCNDVCCWMRLKVCKVDGQNKIVQVLDGNHNLPVCENPLSTGEVVRNCHSYCSEVWDRVGPDDPIQNKRALPNGILDDVEVAISPNPSAHSIRFSYLPKTQGTYQLRLFDSQGKQVDEQWMREAIEGQKIEVTLGTEKYQPGTVFYSLMTQGQTVGVGSFLVVR